ncbi:MAG: class I SAM-dependent methyltransferase [Gemmataceae bacterium]
MSDKQAPPYFDILFARLQKQEPVTTIAFGKHVHWGYWDEPDQADGSPEDYAAAAERLCQQVIRAGAIHDGQRVLDVGCGFGGTIASLNERFGNLDMIGVNIDARQLDRARQEVRPHNGNRVEFIEADACQLPFPNDSFDRILAVECIFHFGDRGAFFAEASRVLRPGGVLALSDFVPPEDAVSVLKSFNASQDEATRRTYGAINVLCSLDNYRALAQSSGFTLDQVHNISRHTLPTYPFLRKHLRTWDDPADARFFDKATGQLEMACHADLLHYTILRFQRIAASQQARKAG